MEQGHHLLRGPERTAGHHPRRPPPGPPRLPRRDAAVRLHVRVVRLPERPVAVDGLWSIRLLRRR